MELPVPSPKVRKPRKERQIVQLENNGEPSRPNVVIPKKERYRRMKSGEKFNPPGLPVAVASVQVERSMNVEIMSPSNQPQEKFPDRRRRKKTLMGQLPYESAQGISDHDKNVNSGQHSGQNSMTNGQDHQPPLRILKRAVSESVSTSVGKSIGKSQPKVITTKTFTPSTQDSPRNGPKSDQRVFPQSKSLDASPKMLIDMTKATSEINPENLANTLKGKDGDTKKNVAPKETQEPINEEALPRLAAELIFPRKKKIARFPLAVYYCRLCDININTLKYADTHAQTAGHRKAKEEYYMQELLESIPWPVTENHCGALNVVLHRMIEQYGRPATEIEQCFQLANWLSHYFQERLHPACQIRLYGSSRTGFALKTSNVNLELLFPPEFNHAQALIASLHLMINDTRFFTNVKQDFGAKWPRITFCASPMGFMRGSAVECVLSVCNLQAFEISLLLDIYAKCFPALVKLAHICRLWAKMCHLDDMHMCGLPAYAFDLMLVHYLQQREPAMLPVLHEVGGIRDKLADIVKLYQFGINHINDIINCFKRHDVNDWNLAELWLGFLKYYALDFDMQNLAVNIRSLKPVTREEKDWNNKRRLGVEDPFLPNKNVAQMPQNAFDYMMHCFRTTYKYFGIPQTIYGPLFDFGEGYKLMLRPAFSALEQGQESSNIAQIQPTIQSTADVQEALRNLLAAMVINQIQHEPSASNEKKAFHLYTRSEMLNLHQDGYECDPSWKLDLKGQTKVILGLEHAKITVSGRQPAINDNCLTESNDGDENGENESVVLTYVPSSSGRTTPMALDAESTNNFMLYDVDINILFSDDCQLESANQILQSTSVDESFIPRRSAMLSESSEISNNDENDYVGRIRERNITNASDCVVEECEDLWDQSQCLDDDYENDQASCDVNGACSFSSDPVKIVTPTDEATPIDEESLEYVKEKSEEPDGYVGTSGWKMTKRRSVVVNVQLMEAVKGMALDDFIFMFEETYFTSGKAPIIPCTFCNILGHHSSVCPEKELPPMVKLHGLAAAYKDTLDRFLYDLSASYVLTSGRLNWQEQFRANLERRLKVMLRPDSRLFLFGSSCNGFGFVRSDLDLCLTFGTAVSLDPNEDPLKIIKAIATILRNDKEYREVLPVTKAKVPIVRFYHLPSRLEGDISLFNCLALRNTELLRTYSLIDERVKALGYIVKVFAKTCDIGDASRGSLSSYAYIIMMLHYLQWTQPPVIPVLQEIYDPHLSQRPSVKIDGWETYFYSDLRNLPRVWHGYGLNQQSVHDLWLGFLCYYTEVFDSKTFVIQMRRSEPLTKFEKLWSDKPLAIEDPFDLTHNLASGLSWRMYIYIMKVFVQAREAFGHSRHEEAILGRLGTKLTYEGLEDYFFNYALRQKEPPPRDRLCKYCGHVGHFAGNCPNKKSNKGKAGVCEETKESMKKNVDSGTKAATVSKNINVKNVRAITKQ